MLIASLSKYAVVQALLTEYIKMSSSGCYHLLRIYDDDYCATPIKFCLIHFLHGIIFFIFRQSHIHVTHIHSNLPLSSYSIGQIESLVAIV